MTDNNNQNKPEIKTPPTEVAAAAQAKSDKDLNQANNKTNVKKDQKDNSKRDRS